MGFFKYQLPLDIDCVGLWRMNETAATSNAIDSSTTANNGVQNNDPGVVTGIVGLGGGNARDVSAANKYFKVPQNAAYCNLTQFTIAAYVYYNGNVPGVGKYANIFDLSDSAAGLGGEEAAGTEAQIQIVLDENKFIWVEYKGPCMGCRYIQSTNTLSTGWHFLVYTWSVALNVSYTVTLYIDNVLSINQTDLCGIAAASDCGFFINTALHLGNNFQDQANCYWRGYLDEIAFYNTVKSQDWINHYALPSQPTVCSLPKISSDFTLNHYTCLPTNYNDAYNNLNYCTPFSLIRRPLWHISGSHMR